MKLYYDLHVFYSRNDGFSVPIEIETEKTLTDIDVINHAINTELIDSEDANNVDYVTEIEKSEYEEMKV